jgi:hypothetical protein
MIWGFLWIAVGIASLARWHIRSTGQVTRMDIVLIVWYGAVAGALIPIIILIAEGRLGDWMDVVVWRKRSE